MSPGVLNSVPARAVLVLLVVAALLLIAAPALTGGAAGGEKSSTALTQVQLDQWIGEERGALLLMWGLKVLLALAGVIFLVREYLRWDRQRHGALALDLPPLPVATPGQALALALLFPLGVQILLTSAFPPGPGRPLGNLEFGVILAVAAFLPPALLTVLRRWRLGGAWLPTLSQGLRTGLAFGCIATLIVLPIQIGWGLALHARGVDLAVQDVVEKFARPDAAYQPWLLGFFGVFVAPFTEEALFRGLLYPALRRRMPGGPFAAAVAVSLLFAAIHGNLMAFVPLFALAMVLTWTMERTNSLLACVVVHALHNASSVLPLLVRHAEGS